MVDTVSRQMASSGPTTDKRKNTRQPQPVEQLVRVSAGAAASREPNDRGAGAAGPERGGLYRPPTNARRCPAPAAGAAPDQNVAARMTGCFCATSQFGGNFMNNVVRFGPCPGNAAAAAPGGPAAGDR